MYDYNSYQNTHQHYSGGGGAYPTSNSSSYYYPPRHTNVKPKNGNRAYQDHGGNYYTSMVMSEQVAPYTGMLPMESSRRTSPLLAASRRPAPMTSAYAPPHHHQPAPSFHSTGSTSSSGFGVVPAHTPAKKVYTHNPYASLVAPAEETTKENYLPYSTATEDATTGGVRPSPLYADPQVSDDPSFLSSNLTEQFLQCVGSISATACTTRGRHLLTSVLCLQHPDKIEVILYEILPAINTVVLDPNGCYVVRLLIEYLSTPQVEALVGALHADTIRRIAVTSQHTRRVLQTIFERHYSEAFLPLAEALAADAVALACHQQGCIAMMRVIERGTPTQKHLLIHTLLTHLPSLTMDPYGNYVVQCILQHTDDITTMAMLGEAYRGFWVRLSCHKFGSNVMEKVMGMLEPEERACTVEELVFQERNLHRLLLDSYGNFVLQAIISSSTHPDEFLAVYKCVTDNLHLSPYGNKIEAKLSSKYKELIPTPEPRRPPTARDRHHHSYNNGNKKNASSSHPPPRHAHNHSYAAPPHSSGDNTENERE